MFKSCISILQDYLQASAQVCAIRAIPSSKSVHTSPEYCTPQDQSTMKQSPGSAFNRNIDKSIAIRQASEDAIYVHPCTRTEPMIRRERRLQYPSPIPARFVSPSQRSYQAVLADVVGVVDVFGVEVSAKSFVVGGGGASPVMEETSESESE